MKSERDKPWHKNASNLLVINSILAAISAIVVQTLVTQTPRHNVLWLLAAVVALFLFVLSAEKTAESFTDDDIDMYVKYSLYYNFGVLFLFAALVGILRHYTHLASLGTLLFSAAGLFGWIWGWGCDTLFLVCQDEHFQRWKAKIQGKNVDAEIEDQCYILRRWACGYLNCEGLRKWARSYINKFCSSMVSYLRKNTQDNGHGSLPHVGVYTRLRPSKIHGVGVFTIREIPKGTALFSDDRDIIWVKERDVATLPKELKRLYEDFAIIRNRRYGCPSNFNVLTMSWYLNDSDNPNVAVDNEYNMSASRDIEVGEELTIDSSKFSEQPYKTRNSE